MLPHFSTLEQFLQWLVGPGAIVAVGFLTAYVLERLSFWHKLAHDLKAVLVVLMSFGVSYGASYVLTQPAILYNEFLNQFFLFIVMYTSTQVAYKRYFEINPKSLPQAPQPVKK